MLWIWIVLTILLIGFVAGVWLLYFIAGMELEAKRFDEEWRKFRKGR